MIRSKLTVAVSLFVSIVILSLATGVHLLTHHPAPITNKSGCTSQEFSLGSSGNCVEDIQTMVDYMETAGLNECPFTDTAALPIKGTYNTYTAQQVSSVQTWVQCYSKQEGARSNVAVSGKVNEATWHLLCSYAYHFPSQSNSSTSPYFQKTIAAGKDAGC